MRLCAGAERTVSRSSNGTDAHGRTNVVRWSQPCTHRPSAEKPGLILALLLAAVVAPPYLPPFLLTVVMLSLVYAILAMSLDVLMGYTGMESLGQAAFFGIGAYTVGIITTRHGAPSWPVAVLVALALGTVGAALAGLLAVRLHGLFFLVMTLAFSQVFWGVSQSWSSMTGGYLGITGIPRPYGPQLGRPLLLRGSWCLCRRRLPHATPRQFSVRPKLTRDSRERIEDEDVGIQRLAP